MPEKILGLDIDEDSITAVQVESGLKGYEITACARVGIEGEGGIHEALIRLFEPGNLKSDVYISSIWGGHVAYRNLRMPFKDAKKIRQTLTFEVESMVPFAIDELVTDFTISDRSEQSEVIAASVRKDFISEYLGHLQAHGIDPEVLDIRCVSMVPLLLKQEARPDDGLLLDIGSKTGTLIVYLKRRVALIRSFSSPGGEFVPPVSHGMDLSDAHIGLSEPVRAWFKSFCTVIRNTLHSMAWTTGRAEKPEKVFFTGAGALYPATAELLTEFLGMPAEPIDLSLDTRVRLSENAGRTWTPAFMDSALALCLRNGKQGDGFNFRKDEFEIQKTGFWLTQEFRRAMILVIIVLVFLAADLGVDYYFLKKNNRMLDERIREVFAQTFPDVRRIVDPVQQMTVKINELKTSAVPVPGSDSNRRVLDLLQDISSRIPPALTVKVTSLVIDQESVRMSGRTDNFNTVDGIKSRLETATQYFSAVTISSANLDRTGKEVRFELKLQLAK